MQSREKGAHIMIVSDFIWVSKVGFKLFIQEFSRSWAQIEAGAK